MKMPSTAVTHLRPFLSLRSACTWFALCFFATFSTNASAKWPSAENVVKAIAPYMDISPDEVEFAFFSMREPDCASTLTAYASAGDYALPAFATGLKVTNLQSIPGMPSMSRSKSR